MASGTSETTSSLGLLSENMLNNIGLEQKADEVASSMKKMISDSLQNAVKPPVMSVGSRPKSRLSKIKSKPSHHSRTTHHSSSKSSRSMHRSLTELRDAELKVEQLRVDNELLLRKDEIEKRKMSLEFEQRNLDGRERILESEANIMKAECEVRVITKYVDIMEESETGNNSVNSVADLGLEQETFQDKFSRMYTEQCVDISDFPGKNIQGFPSTNLACGPRAERQASAESGACGGGGTCYAGLPNLTKSKTDFNLSKVKQEKVSVVEQNINGDKKEIIPTPCPDEKEKCGLFEKSNSIVNNPGFGDSGHTVPQSLPNDSFDWIGQLLMKLSRSDAPECDLEPFDGNPLDFHLFEKQFEDLIESKVFDESGRLNRLIKFTVDSVQDLVKTYLYDDKECAYTNAKAMMAKEYGNPYVIALAYTKAIKDFKIIMNRDDGIMMRKFYLFLQRMKICCERNSDINSELNTQETIRNLVLKLPYNLQERWNRVATTEWQNSQRGPRLNQFVQFVKNESDVANNPSFSKSVMGTNPPARPKFQAGRGQAYAGLGRGRVASAMTAMPGHGPEPLSRQNSCMYCDRSNHDTDDCWAFKNLDVAARQEFLVKKNLCFACYQPCSREHFSKICKDRRTCKICEKPHPTLLHFDRESQDKNPDKSEEGKNVQDRGQAKKLDEKVKLKQMACNLNNEKIAMNYVIVNIECDKYPGKMFPVYAFLDSLSNSSFISLDVLNLLGISDELTSEKVTVVTMTGEYDILSTPASGISIHSLDGKQSLRLPKLYGKDNFPVDKSDILCFCDYEQWDHLSNIDIPHFEDGEIPIGLIIGNNVPRALEPHAFIKGCKNEPYAIKSKFGWSICGIVNKTQNSKVKVNVTSVEPIAQLENAKSIILPNTKDISNEQLSETLQRIYETDFIEITCNLGGKSQEDFKFVETMEKETILLPDNHYQLPLPIRDEETLNLPDNREQAYDNAIRLREKLLKPGNEKLLEQYIEFMLALRKVDHSGPVPPHRLKVVRIGDRWYLVVLHVEHPNKPGKFRLVYHCSKRFKGISLNDILIAGPAVELTSTLIGVFVRWRQEFFAVMGDIEKMFLQARVPEEYRRFLRFFWWDNPKLEGEPIEMEMNVHLFGASSSPACANFALRKTALDNRDEFDDKVVNSVLKNFYVDDLLKSISTLEHGKELVPQIRELCRRGGFNLTKFVATHDELLENIPEENRVKVSQNLTFTDKSLENVNVENSTIEKALGVGVWDILGLVSPFLLKGRKLIQNLSRSEYSWDDVLPDDVINKWTDWIEQLYALENIKINRSFKHERFGEETKWEIHTYCDASDIGYGIAVYVKLENSRGESCVNLAFGKARVLPLDEQSTPRSELVSAVMAAELTNMIKHELEYKNMQTYFWTDSMIVLGYLKNKTKRFKQFVANRIRRILLCSELSQWHHVSSAQNCADDASRGLDARKVSLNHRWFTGSDILYDHCTEISSENCDVTDVQIPDVANDDPELRKDQKCFSSKIESKSESETNPTIELIEKYSDWNKLKFFVASLQSIVINREKPPNIDVLKLQNAEITILKFVQKRHFSVELDRLKSNKPVLQSSQIAKLNPYVDDDGLLRLGGRLENSELDDNLKNPVILPKFDHVTDLIVLHAHDEVAHSGRNATLNCIRTKGFWILHANSKVRYILKRCVKCKKSRGKFGEQKMANLPSDRMQEAPPFTYVGVDLFGHFIVKNGRKVEKRYGAVFTCLSSRSVHIETVSNIDTDNFILALRNFMNRRGPIRLLRSDNGTNFKGAHNELKLAYKEIDFDKVRSFLLTKNCDLEIGFKWRFNTPASSHHGGCWERQIRSIRSILNSILSKNPEQLTTDSLNSFLIEVEGILNCKPLTADFSDPNDPVPLSPINLLTQKSKIVLPPPGVFDDDADMYSRRQWRRVQYFAQQFWTRYRKEYLQILQERSKWNNDQRNLKINDIVILKDDDLCRNEWPMARVVEIFQDSKGSIRSVKIRLARSDLKKKPTYLERPITRLVVIVEAENQETESELKTETKDEKTE